MDKKDKVKFSQMLKNNVYIMKMALKYAPKYTISRFLIDIYDVITNVLWILFVNHLLNALDARKDFNYLLICIVGMASWHLGHAIISGWYWKLYNPYHKLDFQKKLHRLLFEKTANLDMQSYDTPEFYNDYIYSMKSSDKSIINIVESSSQFIKTLLNSIASFSIIFYVSPIVSIVVLILSMMNLFISLYQNHISYKFELKNNKIYRSCWYAHRFFSLPDYAKEIRLSKVSKVMIDKYDKNMDEMLKNELKLYRVYMISGAIRTILEKLAVFLAVTYMTYLLFNGSILVGGFTASVYSLMRLYYSMTNLNYTFSKMSKNSLFADKIRKFLSQKATIVSGDKIPGEFESLEFKNVSFAYKDDNVLENINLKITKGERIAIVGYNGAGKTTLTKLIMRFYDPNDGEILYNGVNLKEYDLEKLRDKIGAVFQDYRIFAATVAENVLGDLYTEDKEQVVIDALKDSTFGAKLDSFEKGIHTELTKEFYDDGKELSGGESQKIAIARVFAHNNELIIMDEPSSALDPIAEYELNLGIDKNAKEKTVIFIAHRLSTTRHTDRIYMFDRGKIIESGSHDELMDKNGKYAEMFTLQASKYQSNE